MNKRIVGAIVRESGIPREKIWVASKLWPSDYDEGKTMAGIDKMFERLNIGYTDARVIIRPSQRNPVKSRVESDLVLLF